MLSSNTKIPSAPLSSGSRSRSTGSSTNHHPRQPKSRRSRYKSARGVAAAAPHDVQWTRVKIAWVCAGAVLVGIFTLTPIFLLERVNDTTAASKKSHVGLHSLLRTSQQVRDTIANSSFSMHFVEERVEDIWHQMLRQPPIQEDEHEDLHMDVGVDAGERGGHETDEKEEEKEDETEEGRDEENSPKAQKPYKSAEKLEKQASVTPSKIDTPTTVSCDTTDNRGYSVCARGVAGLPMSETPALVGARRGRIETCDKNNPSSATTAIGSTLDDLVYWNDPPGTTDVEFTSPFWMSSRQRHSHTSRFLVFEPDPGGWNNIRMSMENLFVYAAVTGRTLVLPPKQPLYLLGMGAQGARGFGSFYNLSKIAERVTMISMVDFLKEHGEDLLELSKEKVTALTPLAEMCLYKENDPRHCDILYQHFRDKGMQPQLEATKNCLVFDEDVFRSGTTDDLAPDLKHRIENFCGDARTAVYYTDDLHHPPLLHWEASSLDYRLLNHFYSFLFFTNPATDNHYKRFVRDYLHYTDEIFCAAGKIVEALGDDFSTLHIRRGDFQYKEVKLSAEEWYNNTKELWKPGEVLYISTDEGNRTWFDPIAAHHPIKFLDDFEDVVDLGDLDSSYLGMIDSIIASRGRVFAGTWFSTFTGYINRLRGYSGRSMKDSWYSFLPRKTAVHEWQAPNGNHHAREWPVGWVGIDGEQVVEKEGSVVASATGSDEMALSKTVPEVTLSDLKHDTDFMSRPMARGVAGRPMAETPALEGGSRAHIQCDVNVDSMAYFNDPQGLRDYQFKSPFAVKKDTKYISFTADRGGWNNVRMSMEIIFVIAAASGRTLVLPPEQNMYLLHHDKGKRHRGFADFFPLHTSDFQSRVPVISFEEFVKLEGGQEGRLPIPEENRKAVQDASQHCEKRAKSVNACQPVEDYLASVGHSPPFRAHDGCVIFDEDVYEGREITPAHRIAVSDFCGNRTVGYWDSDVQEHVLVHFRAGEKQYRLLTHFYNFLLFTDPAIDHYFKRFVRDYLHYHDSIYCAAGKIVKALQKEAQSHGFSVDEDGAGGFSSMHIRRGDFQYKKVKIPAEEWYNNTKEIWLPNEILYIATDERNKTWFDPIAAHHTLRFLDDYWDMVGLGDLDPNYMGMIDTIVASRARAFAGTWFSTFSGYINRMRGYHGMSMKDSWYSFLERKTAIHEWKPVPKFVYAYEWPSGWVGIDSDEWPSRDKF